MKNYRFYIPLLLLAAIAVSSCGRKYDYETVKDDPMRTRIYTLDNGLKVYMSVNRDEPRVAAHIAVRAGARNDPDSATGLAHYFEHLMFKGTDLFGTIDYPAERPLLDEIENQFETFRITREPAARDSIYRIIDSVSFAAAKYAVPNEYDKLMSIAGSSGTNAYTGMDMTVYVENVPSNQIETWVMVQAERFRNPVIRGFHTELETVYEEYNMSLTNDARKAQEAILGALFANHPYGTHTVLGTQEHLKNPSITRIRQFFDKWYVPNNMAICLAGDFDPDKVIRMIDKYFGDKPADDQLPTLEFPAESPIETPVVREVYGNDAARVYLGWRMGGANSHDARLAPLVNTILYNGKSGIIDLDLIQQQKLLSCWAYAWIQADHGVLMLSATPKAGQTLDQAKDLMLGAVEKLRKGDFDESLLEASINNFRAELMSTYESNRGRVSMLVDAFIEDRDWKEIVQMLDDLRKVTKEDIVALANERFGDQNFAVVYKREGADPNLRKIEKPAITPLPANRDTMSVFVSDVRERKVKPIEPVFLDFSKDLTRTTIAGKVPMLYKQNPTNDLFSLIYLFETGSNDDPAMNTAFSYLDYLGAGAMTPEELRKEFFRIACNFNVTSGAERSYVVLSGLGENMDRAVELMELLLNDPQPNTEALENLKTDILKGRSDSKLNQRANFSRLVNYAIYGPESPATNVLSQNEIEALTPDDLIARIKKLSALEHRILYYGPATDREAIDKLEKLHRMADTLQPVSSRRFEPLISQPKVLIAYYDAKQVYYSQVSNTGDRFDPALATPVVMFNNYFGGGMNSIVFQEMRETRALAYSAWADYEEPVWKDRTYSFQASIATQNDKLIDAVEAFAEIIEDMPRSETAFQTSKEALISRMRSERVNRSDVLWWYVDAQDLGLDYDRRKTIFEQAQGMTLDDVQAFHERWIRGRPYVYCILGDERELDMEKVSNLGPVERLTREQLFGY